MDEMMASLLALFLSSIGTIMFALAAVMIYAVCCSPGSITLGDGLPGAFDDTEQLQEEEEHALEIMNDASRQSYLMAKRFVEHNPPNSADTDISLSQFMTIQEKAVAAWEFTFDILQQSSVFVHNRTEIEFRGDMCCVQTNLPLPKQKEVVYWEAKLFDVSPGTVISIGLTTKPYPVFRLPGMHRYSVAYESTGVRRLNQPFSAPRYGRPMQQGDVIGVGYRVRSGTVFFTHNGKKLDEVVHGMRLNLFPTVGATGPCQVHCNLGQAGFVFIQAIVKEWGLAPAQGTLAPPPPYGDQTDSVLLEATARRESNGRRDDPPAPPYVYRTSLDDSDVPLISHPRAGPSGEQMEVPGAVPDSVPESASESAPESAPEYHSDPDSDHGETVNPSLIESQENNGESHPTFDQEPQMTPNPETSQLQQLQAPSVFDYPSSQNSRSQNEGPNEDAQVHLEEQGELSSEDSSEHHQCSPDDHQNQPSNQRQESPSESP